MEGGRSRPVTLGVPSLAIEQNLAGLWSLWHWMQSGTASSRSRWFLLLEGGLMNDAAIVRDGVQYLEMLLLPGNDPYAHVF